MAHDRLIRELTRDFRPFRSSHVRDAARWLLVVALLELALLGGLGLLRADLVQMACTAGFWAQILGFGAIALASCIVILRSLRPGGASRITSRLSILTLVCLVAVISLFLLNRREMIARDMIWDGSMFATAIVLLAAPMLICMGLLMRHGAPTDLSGSALAAGLAAATWGAFLVTLVYPFGSALFVMIWGGAACLLTIFLGRLWLPWFARW